MTRFLISTLGLLLLSASAFGQTAKTDPKAANASEEAQKQPNWVASLLLIRADWSKSPAAKEIDADLRKALSGELVKPDQLQTLPASGPALLFPTETASIYTKEHYAGLLSWLKVKGLVLESEPFSIGEFESATPRPDGTNLSRRFQLNVLAKDLEFLGLTYPSEEPDQALVARKVALTWEIQHDSHLAFARTLRSSEKPRGEDRFIDRGMHDQCIFNREALNSGEVLIVQAFPSSNDRTFRVAASQQGFMALVVVEGYPPNFAPAVEPRLILPDKLERLRVQKNRSAERDLMVDQNRTQGSSRYVICKNIMINWSEANDLAWGFSKSLGTWAKQELKPPATDVKGIVVDDDLAVWRVGPAYYGFSGETGRWDVLRLADGHTPPPVMDNGFARVHDGDDVYTFAGSTGRWSSPKDSTSIAPPAANPDLEIKKREIEEQYKAAQTKLKVITQQLTNPDLDPSTQEQARLKSEAAQLVRQIDSKNRRELGLTDEGINEGIAQSSREAGAARSEGATETKPDGTQLKVFSLRNISAVEAERIVNQIFRREIHSAAADERTNSLIVRAFPDDLNIIFAILVRLDEVSSHQPPAAGTQGLANGAEPITAASVASSVKQYEAKERQAATLASQIRELLSGGKGDKARLDKLTADLNKVVGEAFAARQQLHQAELVQLQQRTNSIRQNLTTRESLKDRIIDRRVKDLLDPDVQWENASRATSETKSTAAGGQSNAALASQPQVNNELVYVPVNWQSRQEEQIIWNVLGVRVQAIAEQSVAKFNYKGGLLVDDIRTAPQPSELRVGDVILGLHIWETKSPNELAWILLQPLSKNVAILNPRDRESEEKAVIYVLRDGQRVHFEIKLPPSMVDLQRTNLPPRPDLGTGTSNAATKGAAQSPASRSQPSLSNSPQPAESKTPGTTSVMVSGKTTLRAPHEFRERLIEQERWLAEHKATDPTKYSGDPESNKKLIEEAIRRDQRELDFLREEYATQLRLLELEVQDAAAAVASAQQMQKLAQEEVASGRSSQGNLLGSERAVQEANLRFQRAKTLFELYRKADPKNPTDELQAPAVESAPR